MDDKDKESAIDIDFIEVTDLKNNDVNDVNNQKTKIKKKKIILETIFFICIFFSSIKFNEILIMTPFVKFVFIFFMFIFLTHYFSILLTYSFISIDEKKPSKSILLQAKIFMFYLNSIITFVAFYVFFSLFNINNYFLFAFTSCFIALIMLPDND